MAFDRLLDCEWCLQLSWVATQLRPAAIPRIRCKFIEI